ncbi:MAG: hypothetical protein HY699_10440 [Deltaproteobacteria bacterium]|nr:hypothetical protein [Deltaproteobacteria bacterium]
MARKLAIAFDWQGGFEAEADAGVQRVQVATDDVREYGKILEQLLA